MLKHVDRTTTFLREYKRLNRKHYNMDALETVIRLLFSEQKDLLINRYRDHALKGDLRGFRELHIEADWLLIYRIDRDVLTLVLIETGSHDDLFG